MKFLPTPLAGAHVVELEPLDDERGFFARSWCREEFAKQGLRAELAQCSLSYNRRRGTLRGLHYQAPPRAEAKLVQCLRGSVFDVVVDLRPGSETFGRWHGVELSWENRRGLYVPEGCAHGFETLGDEVLLSYFVSETYAPECARGVRWDDPRIGVAWPIPPRVISARDRRLPLLEAR